jgi:hypothetical protein
MYGSHSPHTPKDKKSNKTLSCNLQDTLGKKQIVYKENLAKRNKETANTLNDLAFLSSLRLSRNASWQ